MPLIITAWCTNCKKAAAGTLQYVQYWLEEDGSKTHLSHPFEGFILYDKWKEEYKEKGITFNEMEKERSGCATAFWDTENKCLIYIDEDREEKPDNAVNVCSDEAVVICKDCGEKTSFAPFAMS
jgi:hypothetical protein